MREQAVTLDMGRGSRPLIRTSGNPRNRNCDAVEQARSKIAGLVSDQGERSLRKSETYRIEIEAMVALKGNVGIRIVPRTFQSSEATARQTDGRQHRRRLPTRAVLAQSVRAAYDQPLRNCSLRISQ